jgi:hypothetical protein
MGFTYEDEELELVYKTEIYKFRAPSAIEEKALSAEFQAYKPGESKDPVDLYIDFFVNLGLPAEVLSKMSSKGLTALLAYATGTKKN